MEVEVWESLKAWHEAESVRAKIRYEKTGHLFFKRQMDLENLIVVACAGYVEEVKDRHIRQSFG